MVLATPDSVRTHRPSDPTYTHTFDRDHSHPKPHSPFRIPATPRTSRPPHAAHATRLSYSAHAHGASRDVGTSTGGMLGSPFSVTRVRYTTASTPSKEGGRGIEHARHASVASVASAASMDSTPSSSRLPGREMGMMPGPSTHKRTESSLDTASRNPCHQDLGEQESLTDTPSRTRRSTSGSSCSGSGTSSASLLSLGRSSEEHTRYSVAIWDEAEGGGSAEGAGMSGRGRGLFGEGYEVVHGLSMQGNAGNYKGEKGVDEGKGWNGVEEGDGNASVITLAPPRRRPSGSPVPLHVGQIAASRAPAGRYTITPDDLTPPHTRATPSAHTAPLTHARDSLHPTQSTSPASPYDTCPLTDPSPGESSKSTPARRKSPFHFIPRLIPAYRRRTRAPSGASGASGAKERRPVAGLTPERDRWEGGEGLSVTVHEDVHSPTFVGKTVNPVNAVVGENQKFGPSNVIGSTSTRVTSPPFDRDGESNDRVDPRAGGMLARTPSSPSTTLLHRPNTTMPANTHTHTRFALAYSFEDDDDIEMPSPSKPPTGHRPGNPRRATAPGVGHVQGTIGLARAGAGSEAGRDTGIGGMLAPSAFNLSPCTDRTGARRPTPPGSGSSIRSTDSTSTSTASASASGSRSGSSRPSIRRGITAPGAFGLRSLLHPDPDRASASSSSSAKPLFATPPPLFNDIRPSPAAFASTGLIKKKSGMRGVYGAGGAGGGNTSMGLGMGKGQEAFESMYSPAPVGRAVVGGIGGMGFDRFARALRAGKGLKEGKNTGAEGSGGGGVGESQGNGQEQGSQRFGPRAQPTLTATSASHSASHSHSTSTSNSTANSTSTSQPHGRGLRRKGSTIFGSSGSISISSISSVAPFVQPTNGACATVSGATGKDRNRSGSAISGEVPFGSSMGRTASSGSGFGLGMAMGMGVGGSPVTPTKGAFTLPRNYNTITPPPHRPAAFAYPFARARPNVMPATVVEDDLYTAPISTAESGSPCGGSSPNVRIDKRTTCLGASTSTTASTSTSTSVNTESTGTSSPLGSRTAGTPHKPHRALFGNKKASGGNGSAPFGHGPLVRASNPMLGATYRQHQRRAQRADEREDERRKGDVSTGLVYDLYDSNENCDGGYEHGNELDEDGDEATDVDDVDDDLDMARDTARVTSTPGEKRRPGAVSSSRPDGALLTDNRADGSSARVSAPAGSKNSSTKSVYSRSSFISSNKLDRDFVLVQGIGAGEFSQVWKVRSRRDGRVSAVKAGKMYTGVKNRLRQLEEVSILHALRQTRYAPTSPLDAPPSSFPSDSTALTPSDQGHPHVLTFLSAWEHKSRLYIQTALSPLGDLARFLEACGDTAGLGEVRAWKLLVELTDALRYIHAQGVVHLDIKPRNVFIEKGGSVVVGDFGMAARLKRRPDSSTSVGGSGTGSGEVGQGVWGTTGVETSLADPPARRGDGSFYWPSAEDADAADTMAELDNAQRAGHTLSPKAHSGGQKRTSPSPMLERDVEGDREYLSPEALNGNAVLHVGTHSDVYSLGIMLLEAVGNVALPSNGDGWHRLRSDDYTDFADCFLPRAKHSVDADTGRVVSTLDKRQGTDTNLPVLSDELLDVIKGLMRSHPARRMTLEEVWGMEVVQRVKGLMGRARRESAGVRGEGEEDEGAVWCGALVEEEEDAVELLFPCA